VIKKTAMRIDAVVRGRASLKRDHPERLCENQPGGLQEKRPKMANQIFTTPLPSKTKGRRISSGSLESDAGIFML
jgi:hypothetical protein